MANLLNCGSTASYLGWPAVQEGGVRGGEHGSDKHLLSIQFGSSLRTFSISQPQ